MLSNEELARMAEQTADLIALSGWFRGEGIDYERFPVKPDNKCFCVLTAIPYRNAEYFSSEFARYLGWQPFEGVSHANFLIEWNDSQKSAEDVIRAIREFASTVRGHVVASR